jgi:hypothetical protein
MNLMPESCHSRRQSLCPTEETMMEHLEIDEKINKNQPPVRYIMPMINTLGFLNKRSKSAVPKKT